ncbi:MAG: prepilin-type N-terminal cleavage/methylation domain-containing protein [Proteobacteria bacterium]|nr:prepilin-type N-terminal cleavage/methylation domain-containing protein [Pseudomonadota bacterium]
MKTLTGQLKQAGISLLEVLLSLAIISIVLVMAVQWFGKARSDQQLNIVRTFIGADMAAIQAYGINNNGDYTGLDWKPLVDNGYLTTDTKNLNCTDGGCTQVTPWGKDVTIGGQQTAQPTLSIPLPNSNLCQNLVQSYGAKYVACDDAGTATITINGVDG